MSQIEINNSVNSVNVQNTTNTVNVDQEYSNIIVVPQEVTNVVEVVTPGPQGAKGEPGDPSLFTSSFVSTASFFAFTSSYYSNSASFSASISQLQDFSSSLDTTFATDAQLNALSSSFTNFTSSYNTGSFTGSFTGLFSGNGSGIVGVISSSYALTASYAGNVPETASYAISASQAINANNAISSSYALTASYASNVPVTASYAVSASQATNANNAISSSYALTASYANNIPATASYAISASQATTASYAIISDTSSFQTNIAFAQSHIPFFDSDNSLSSSAARQWLSESIVINREYGTFDNPEALFVFQPSTESINIATFRAKVDNYVQIDVKNESSGSSASSDIVATADNGDEFTNFIDMGINSSTFNSIVGDPNDAYLYSTGNDLLLGNASAGKSVRIFTGGGLIPVYTKLVLNDDNLHELTGSLNITDNLIVQDSITGSLFGTASYAVSASQALTASFIDGGFY